MGPAQWFPEMNFVSVDFDEIPDDSGRGNFAGFVLPVLLHEQYHKATVRAGASVVRQKLSGQNADDLLGGSPSFNSESILIREIASDMLHLSSVPLVEALAVLAGDMWADVEQSEGAIYLRQTGKTSKADLDLLSELQHSTFMRMKEKLLADSEVSSKYEKLKEIERLSGGPSLGVEVLGMSLDIPFDASELAICSQVPTLDPSFRFELVFEAITKSIKERNSLLQGIIDSLNKTVMPWSETMDERIGRSIRLMHFVEHASGLRFGFSDWHAGRVPPPSYLISWDPTNEEEITDGARTKEEYFELLKTKVLVPKPSVPVDTFLLELIQNYVCSMMESNGRWKLVANPNVDDQTRKLWLRLFYAWLSKELIVSGREFSTIENACPDAWQSIGQKDFLQTAETSRAAFLRSVKSANLAAEFKESSKKVGRPVLW